VNGFLICDNAGLAFGSTADQCSECRERVMVAPSGRRQAAEKKLAILCVQCGMKHLTETGAKIEPPTPDQLAEIQTRILWDAAHRRRN
jgi:hypothetical protein